MKIVNSRLSPSAQSDEKSIAAKTNQLFWKFGKRKGVDADRYNELLFIEFAPCSDRKSNFIKDTIFLIRPARQNYNNESSFFLNYTSNVLPHGFATNQLQHVCPYFIAGGS